MSGLVSVPPVAPPAAPAATVLTSDFWPAVALADFRADARIPASVADRRLIAAVRGAVSQLADELAPLQLAAAVIDPPALTLADVPSPVVAGVKRTLALWTRALTHLVRAELAEDYRGLDTTLAGDRRADALDLSADDHRARARAAVRDLLGRPRTNVDLI